MIKKKITLDKNVQYLEGKDSVLSWQKQRCWLVSLWQALVVTELAPAHHSRENSQRSLTTHRFTVTFCLRRSLSNTKTSTPFETEQEEL
uniref:Uncharacterized protein n=1 Tax=Amphilophus citrinellus TaxID=61819 RepID=A0A3Q0RW68_AMPCI